MGWARAGGGCCFIHNHFQAYFPLLKNLLMPNVTCHHVIRWVFLEGTVWKFSLGRCSGACFFFTAVSGEKNLCIISYALGIS